MCWKKPATGARCWAFSAKPVMGDLLLTARTGVKLLNCRWAHHLASNELQPWEASEYRVWWKKRQCWCGREVWGAAEKDICAQKKCIKKCLYQEGGREGSVRKMWTSPRRNSLIYELDVFILAEEKNGEEFWDAEPGLILRGPSELSQVPQIGPLVFARDHGPNPAFI